MLTNRKISYINSLRCFATLSVVFLHTSAGLLDARKICNADTLFWLSCYKYTMEFSVPLFVMISGTLFLNPAKEIYYGIILHKYVKRIALALLIFGLPMCFIETYFSKYGGVVDSLINFIEGHSWNHMWYLYMIIGLYMMTPIIKPFVVNTTDRNLLIALGVLFILSSLLPTLELMGVSLDGYMIISSPYIFIYILGYFLCWRIPKVTKKHRMLLIVIICACFGIIIMKCYCGISSYGYADPILIVFAAAIFLLFKSLDIKYKLANKFTPYCFGVYLIHTVFINFTYKYCYVDEEIVVPFFNFIGFFIMFTIAAFCGTFIMMKIPFMKKHIL